MLSMYHLRDIDHGELRVGEPFDGDRNYDYIL